MTSVSRWAGWVRSVLGSIWRRLRALLAEQRLLREVLLVAFAIVVYFGIRNATAGAADVATENADRVVRFEHAVGVSWEDEAQSVIVGSRLLVTFANWVYIWGHWPVILTTAVVLFLRRPDRYYLLRNAMFLSGAIGFAFFALFPLAPPRLIEADLVDTVTERSNAYRALQPPSLTNQYAAFPSLHFGWNLLLGIVLLVSTSVLAIRLLAMVLPLLMAFAVVATANHFIVDVVGGLVIALIALSVVAFRDRPRAAATLAVDGVPCGGTRRPSERVALHRRTPRG